MPETVPNRLAKIVRSPLQKVLCIEPLWWIRYIIIIRTLFITNQEILMAVLTVDILRQKTADICAKLKKTLLIRTAKKSLRCTNANLKISSVGIILSRFPDSWGQKNLHIFVIFVHILYMIHWKNICTDYRHGQKLEKNKLQKPPNLHSLSTLCERNALPRNK